MNVDFNNLRVQSAYALDDLTQKLNAGILKEHTSILEEDGSGNEIWKRGNLLVDSDDIQKHMDSLRSLILTINAVYEPEDEKFKDMSDEIKKNGGVSFFNKEDI